MRGRVPACVGTSVRSGVGIREHGLSDISSRMCESGLGISPTYALVYLESVESVKVIPGVYSVTDAADQGPGEPTRVVYAVVTLHPPKSAFADDVLTLNSPELPLEPQSQFLPSHFGL